MAFEPRTRAASRVVTRQVWAVSRRTGRDAGGLWYPSLLMRSKLGWKFVILASLLMSDVSEVRSDTPDASTASGTLLQQGRDLMKRGEMMAAKERFEAAFRSTGDAEALFLAAECSEKVGNVDEAETHYRQYLQLPLALKAAEARSRIQVIEARKGKADDTESRRRSKHVLVPVDKDHGACAEKCTAANVCPRPARTGSRATDYDECLGNQFSCLRSCEGATVETGSCPKISPQQHLRCFEDKRRTVGAGWISPGHF
jgi:tetratricopeptide (TPR) repeat protein